MGNVNTVNTVMTLVFGLVVGVALALLLVMAATGWTPEPSNWLKKRPRWLKKRR